MTFEDKRQHAPATQRNRQPILEVLKEVLPPTGTVLEISAGTGEHSIFFAPRLQPRQWLPTDFSPFAVDSIFAWQEIVPSENLHPPLQLDVTENLWAVEADTPGWVKELLESHPLTAIVSINMIHIAPWSACLGLLAGAERLLDKNGILYLYGPFQREGEETAPSNVAFDLSLRDRDREWGVRNLEDVVAIAQKHHLELLKVIPMPANNLSVIFQRK